MRKGVQDSINSWFHLNKLLKHAKQWYITAIYRVGGNSMKTCMGQLNTKFRTMTTVERKRKEWDWGLVFQSLHSNPQ